MADEKNPLDALNSILDEAQKADNQPAVDDVKSSDEVVSVEPKTQDEQEEIEIAGRTFKWDRSEISKWGNSLQKDYTKKSQLLAEREKEFNSFKTEHAKAIELAQYFKDNPKFQDEVLGVWEKYAKSVAGGASVASAAKKSGLNDLPPEVQKAVKTMERFEQFESKQVESAEDALLEQEIEELKKAIPGLTDKYLESVLKEAARWNGRAVDENDPGISLMEIHKMMSSKHAWRKAEKAKDTGVSSVASEYVAPAAPAPAKRTHDDVLMDILKQAGN